MWSLTCLTIVAVCLSSSYGRDVNVTGYIYWTKADMNAWNLYFPSRALYTEMLTNNAAVDAVNSMAMSMNNSLRAIMAFQAQELTTAQALMAGTSAEGCLGGITNYIPNAINDAINTYADSTADALSKISRLSNSWAKLNSTYNIAYLRALQGIDACQKNYPNSDSYDRLKSCVQYMKNNYIKVANDTTNSLSPSPSMTYFTQTVVKSASDAALGVTAKGYTFLQMLFECAQLSGNIDLQQYKEELSKWKGYNDTLAAQITASQTRNREMIQEVEANIINYMRVEKEILQQYMIESRGFPFYRSQMYSNLSDYFNTILSVSMDNPGDANCAETATTTLKNVVNAYANQALMCDIEVVNNTKRLMSNIRSNYGVLTNTMPFTGDLSILSSIIGGFMFAPNNTQGYTALNSTRFNILKEELQTSTTNDVNTLSNYLAYFFSQQGLPCGDSFYQSLKLEGEVVLYNLQRCLYISSGTTYTVTTPEISSTTTPSYTTTTNATTY